MSDRTTHQDDPTAGPAPQAGGQRFGRRGILLLGALGTAVAGLASVATRGAFADAGTLTAATSSATATPAGPHGGARARPGGSGAGFAPPAGAGMGFAPSAGMGPRLGPPWGGMHGGWTVGAVNGATISAKRADGTKLTVTTNGSTVYQVTRPGEPQTAGALTDVGAGDQIEVIGTLSGTRTVSAETVVVHPAGAGGQVTAVSGTTVTVSGARSTTQQIHLAAGAIYRLETYSGAVAGKAADIQVGSVVMAQGTLNNDGSLLARLVQIAPPSIDGTVTSVTNGAILVQRPVRPPRPNAASRTTTTATASPATVQTIHVTASTRYLLSTTYGPGITSPGSLTNVANGVRVHAIGTHNSDGSLTATVLIVSTASRAGTLLPQ